MTRRVDETAEYLNFSFSQSLYGQNPRTYIVGDESLDDKAGRRSCAWPPSTAGRSTGWRGCSTGMRPRTSRRTTYYPGLSGLLQRLRADLRPKHGDGVTPSACGIGETAYTPGPLQYVDGLPIIKDDVYINAFETHFTDLAAFGEAHRASDLGVEPDRRQRAVSDRRSRQGSRTRCCSTVRHTPRMRRLSDQWRRALWKLNTAYQIDANQPGLRHLVAGLPSRRRQRAAAGGAARNLRHAAGAEQARAGHGRQLRDRRQGHPAEARLRYSAAIYDIQWHNIQEGVDLTPLVLPGALNIGDGYSRGLELELDALLTQPFQRAPRLHLRSDQAHFAQPAVQRSPIAPSPHRRPAARCPAPRATASRASSSTGMCRSPAASGASRSTRTTKATSAGAFGDHPDGAGLHHAGCAPQLCARALAHDALRQ